MGWEAFLLDVWAVSVQLGRNGVPGCRVCRGAGGGFQVGPVAGCFPDDVVEPASRHTSRQRAGLPARRSGTFPVRLGPDVVVDKAIAAAGFDGTIRSFGKCLDIVGNGTANFAKVQLWTVARPAVRSGSRRRMGRC